MSDKELLKSEIDHLSDEYIDFLIKLVKSWDPSVKRLDRNDWESFVDNHFGILKNDPIFRGDQGSYEKRNHLK
jgi:hypothetical protein